MKTKNKLLTVLLTFCMVLALMPVTVFAQNSNPITAVTVTGATLSYKPGDRPKDTASVPEGANYKIDAEIWVETDQNGDWTALSSTSPFFELRFRNAPVKENFQFEEGKTYLYYISLLPIESTFVMGCTSNVNGRFYSNLRNDYGMVIVTNLKMTPSKTGQLTKYAVKFDSNGGKALSMSEVNVESGNAIGTLPTVSRKNYTFKGWYTKKSGGTKVTSSTKITENMTLYAQWTKVSVKKASAPTVKKAGSGKMSVKLNKVSDAKGYQIVYSTSSKFKGSKSVATTSLKKTISKLKKGETYYVKVRAYKTDSQKNKVYGKYSKTVKIKL